MSGPQAIDDPFVERESIKISRPRPGVARMRIASEPLGVLRQAVKRAMLAGLRELEADALVRCLIITGTERAFSVGSDVREFRREASWHKSAAAMDQGLNLALEDSRLPVIAACNGLTLGGGNELALACDIRLAARSARFGFPEVKVAAFASAGGTQRLPLLVGPGRAMELLLTGRLLDADEAAAIGLVDELVDDELLDGRSLELASAIAAMPAVAIAATKRCVSTGLRHGRPTGHDLENLLTVEVGMTEEAAEGQAAFMEKRPPRFHKPGE
jgi:enoyl-CoA hydratase